MFSSGLCVFYLVKLIFVLFCFFKALLLTVAGPRVFDLQDQALVAGRLLHGALAGVGGVVAGTHTLPCAPLRTGILARGTATPASTRVPQTFPSAATRDVRT